MSEKITQLVLPKRYHPMVFKELHQEMGHLGTDRVFSLARQSSSGPICIVTLNILLLRCVLV